MSISKTTGVMPAFETRPLYQQVHDQLMSNIVSGQWKSGEMIQNEVELARDFGVSVGTMRKALQALTEQGLLTRRQGRGSFVAEQQAMDALPLDNVRTGANDPLQWIVAWSDLTRGEANISEASALSCRQGSGVLRLRRLVQDASTGSALLEYSTLPEELFAGLAADPEARELPIAFLARRYGLLVGLGTERVAICIADREQAKLLSVRPGEPLLKLERVATSFDHVALECRTAYCNLQSGAVYANRIR